MSFRNLSLWLTASTLFFTACGNGGGQGFCGDGIEDRREECDDGNLFPGDGCDENCVLEGGPNCGDGNLDAGEGCDDGNLLSEDGCSAACAPETCNDGVVQAGLGEECDDGNLVPGDGCDPICQNPPTEDTFLFSEVDFLFDQAQYCDQMMKRHAVVRALDLQDGNLRWRCGDVTAIEPENYGQEYCEYMALVNGSQVSSMGSVSDDDQMFCMFTAVFSDTLGIDEELAAALAQPENLGAPVDPALVRMSRSVNSKGAANALIGDCSTLPGSTNEVRQVACYQAFAEAEAQGDLVRAQELRDLCRGQNLNDIQVVGDNPNFAQAQQLGAVVLEEGDPGFQDQRNIRACVATPRGGGVFFRNSDTNICARTFRAGLECNCSYAPLPGALDGFLFTEWLTPENNRIPPECRLARVDGVDYPHLMLCEVPAQELPEVRSHPIYSNDLQGFCNDRFGKNLGILAPLRAIEVAGSCTANTEFCQDFSN